MNIEDTKKAVEVMQAYIDGKEIEFRFSDRDEHGDEWRRNRKPNWLWHEFEYRIKPEPRVIYVNEYSDVENVFYDNASEARAGAGSSAKRIATKFIEVIE